MEKATILVGDAGGTNVRFALAQVELVDCNPDATKLQITSDALQATEPRAGRGGSLIKNLLKQLYIQVLIGLALGVTVGHFWPDVGRISLLPSQSVVSSSGVVSTSRTSCVSVSVDRNSANGVSR